MTTSDIDVRSKLIYRFSFPFRVFWIEHYFLTVILLLSEIIANFQLFNN